MNLVSAGKCELKKKVVHHVDCPKGGRDGIAVTGYGFRDLPIGFGGRNGKLVVDCARQKFYSGWCMDCHKEGRFILNRKATLKTKIIRLKRQGATKWVVA